MSDYFDQLETGLKDAVKRRAHMPWYARMRRVPTRHRGLMVVLAALVVATPTVGAVGAVSGWFSQGRPDVYYPPSPTSGTGKVVAGTQLLPIRVPDPDGGPPWGLRLVRTNRGDTCVQVGRVEDRQLGSLGIDYSWGNDHMFHAINPNDSLYDDCGATDGAGHGFVTDARHGWPASGFMPDDSGVSRATSYCQAASPLPRLRSMLKRFPKGSKSRAAFEQRLKITQRALAKSKIHACPAGSLRMVFTGLLGPDAKSITYRTPSGQTRTENTVGSDGAYLIVFRQTAKNCDDFSTTLDGGSDGCAENYGGSNTPDLQGPNAVISVTYANGKTCSDLPTPQFAAAYKRFRAKHRRSEPAKQERAQFNRFLASQHLSLKGWLSAVDPRCPPVGWASGSRKRVTAAKVAAPIKITTVTANQLCSDEPKGEAYKGVLVPCDSGVPKGYWLWQDGPGNRSPKVLVTVSFRARMPVTSANSWYEWSITYPRHGCQDSGGSEGGRIDKNISVGQRISWWTVELGTCPGTYRGAVAFEPNAGQSGSQGPSLPGREGSITVGRFSFKVP